LIQISIDTTDASLYRVLLGDITHQRKHPHKLHESMNC